MAGVSQKQAQTITQKQTGTLSPQQIQVIRMLELQYTELESRILEELQNNVALELDQDSPKEDTYSEEDYSLPQDDEYDPQEDTYGQDNDGWQEDDQYVAANDSVDYDEVYMSGMFDGEYDSNYDGGSDDIPEYKLRVFNYSADDEETEVPYSEELTFHEYLQEQLGQKPLSEKEREICNYIVGAIDDDGYLTRTPEQMVDDILFKMSIDITDEEMERMVGIVRQLDPAGVGATSPQDCMLLQLKRMGQSPIVQTSILIVNKCFEELKRHHYDRIRQRLNLQDEEVRDAIQLIQHLNPKPGSGFVKISGEAKMNHITPDFLVEREGNELIVSLIDSDLPVVRISKSFVEDLDRMSESKDTSKKNKESIRFYKERIDSAKWFLDAIQQRNETLINTMRAIVHFQRDFFLEGDDAFMRPMILQDIADRTGYDVSTISRVNSEKFVKTEFGTFSLKHFFSESIDDAEGQEVSTRKIKKVLREVVDAEDKSNPLSDDQLVDIMLENGCRVARRTIAKYRQQLDIPVARLRKEV